VTYLNGGHPKNPEPEIRCTFCGTPLAEVRRMAFLNYDRAICDGCVTLCAEILSEADQQDARIRLIHGAAP